MAADNAVSWSHAADKPAGPAPDHPLRDAKPANDGNLYPYNSKLRPPPLWIDEDGVEIADQPKVIYSDPHYCDGARAVGA
jgi:hypothetical protein